MAQGITPHLSETRCAGPSQGTSGRPRRKCTEPGATRSEFRRRQRPGDAGSQISRSPEVCRPRTTAHGPGRTVHCYYDPMVGQSISPDPLVLATGYANGLFRFQWGAVDRIEGGLMVVGQVTPPA